MLANVKRGPKIVFGLLVIGGIGYGLYATGALDKMNVPQPSVEQVVANPAVQQPMPQEQPQMVQEQAPPTIVQPVPHDDSFNKFVGANAK